MKGVIIAGWTWSRLFPITKWVNKHLLPIYDKPMIYYPIQTLVNAWIYEILIITSADAIGPLSKQLWSWWDFKKDDNKQIQILYWIQNEPLWISHALWISQSFLWWESACVILWDNIIEDNITDEVKKFKSWAKIFLKEVNDPKRFWVAEIKNDKVIWLEEKPKKPKSNKAVIWLYLYDKTVFDKIRKIHPSWRNELEITCVNKEYLKEWTLKHSEINGHWFDTWTFESIQDAGIICKKLGM